MTEYTVNGQAMTLSIETSRACGHHGGINGTPSTDGPAAWAARAEVRRDAMLIAKQLGRSVEIYAQHPSAPADGVWLVDVIERVSTVWKLVPAGTRDEYAAGYEGNRFDTLAEAEAAIPGLRAVSADYDHDWDVIEVKEGANT